MLDSVYYMTLNFFEILFWGAENVRVLPLKHVTS